jgi:hypothetical protein
MPKIAGHHAFGQDASHCGRDRREDATTHDALQHKLALREHAAGTRITSP